MENISIALPKGRMADSAITLFEKAGIAENILKDISRKLVVNDHKNLMKFMLVKPMDVPTYVEHGAAVLDLKFGFCKMVVAGPKEAKDSFLTNKRVATKFPNIAEEFFRQKGENVEIIKLNGSVELAPIVGLSEVIVDIVETGNTLRENGLIVIEEIFPSSARLIVNKASLKTKSQRIKEIIIKLKEVVETFKEVKTAEISSKK